MKALRRVALAVAVLLVLLGVVLLSDWLRQTPGPTFEPVRSSSAIDRWQPPWPTPAPEAVPAAAGPAKRWIVVGWDGASWDLILPMIEAGKLPNLAALMQRGAYGPMASFEPTLSPVLWTTVATGMPPSAHGIRGFDVPKTKLEKRLERLTHWGKLTRRLYDNTDRHVRAVWNLLADAGRPVLIAGYHNTYPAEDVTGLMVANYLMQDLMSRWMHASGGVDPELAETLVHPVQELPEILRIETSVRARFATELPRFAALDETRSRRVLIGEGLDPSQEPRLFFLRQAFLADTFNAEVAAAYFERVRPDLTLVHFQAIDLASHYYLYYHRPEAYGGLGMDAATVAALDADRGRFEGTVTAFHDELDMWLGKFSALAGDDTGIIVVSDHGFAPVADAHRPGGHEEAPPGIVVIAGPGVRRGARIDGATLYDVFPTLAACLGLPLSKELPGQPIAQAFEPGMLDAASRNTIATYETGERYVPRVAPPSALGAELEKQLKSLGYIK